MQTFCLYVEFSPGSCVRCLLEGRHNGAARFVSDFPLLDDVGMLPGALLPTDSYHRGGERDVSQLLHLIQVQINLI